MSQLNDMLNGDLSEIADKLRGDNPPLIDATLLSAIITNICRKSDILHKRIVRLESERK